MKLLTMTETQPARYSCSSCGGKYQVVRVENASTADGEEALNCVSCGAPLPAYDGAFALKYFLVGGFERRRRRQPFVPAITPSLDAVLLD